MSSRLADADESAAVVNKLLNSGDNLLVCPIFAAALCGVGIAHIDDYIKIVEQILVIFNIIKADERNIKRCAAECLDDAEV